MLDDPDRKTADKEPAAIIYPERIAAILAAAARYNEIVQDPNHGSEKHFRAAIAHGDVLEAARTREERKGGAQILMVHPR